MEIVKRGAEAIIYRDGDRIIKVRVKKSYRHPELDVRIRLQRTRREARLIQKVREIGIRAPKVHEVDEKEYRIVMEYIDGITLKNYLKERKDREMMRRVGRIVGEMHRSGIVHGDITTSNFIVKDGEIYVIDFGLGEVSRSLEDRAVDLVCFKKSYFATHSDFEEGWKSFLEGYREVVSDADEVFERMEEVERRARYL